ncbi:MAG: hypothetical protein GY849_02470 [Deltaproteobacteria bacterium]|nr:hypothetical protein [Deltaproteobacteria bacterium]
MQNFQELFNSAKELSDKRNKIFNQLKESFKKEILPEYIKIINNISYEVVYFKSDIEIFGDEMETSFDPELGEEVFTFAIHKDGFICDATRGYDGCGFVWEYNSDYKLEKINNKGILDLIYLVNSRLKKHIKQMEKDIEKANKLI